MCAKFLWNIKSGQRGLHWAKWDDLCKPKCFGELGFRKLIVFNCALLAKHVWLIIQNPQSLMAKVLKSRYFKNSDIMKVAVGNNPSFIWSFLI